MMLLSLSSTTPDATDLGYVVHKHPDRVRSVDVGFGVAHVFFPEATPERCTVTLLVEVDPVRLTRRQKGSWRPSLEPYVNDRPYAASSLLSVALGRLFSSALAGRCEKPDLVERLIDLEISLPVMPVRGGEHVLHRLFAPLGYQVASSPIAFDPRFPSWGDSSYRAVHLAGRQTVRAALEHLFVLMPVLDDRKHYWIGREEIDKLVRRGGEWLADHPDQELIARRYLRRGVLVRDALARLADTTGDPDATDERHDEEEAVIERPLSLNVQRLQSVMEVVEAHGGGWVVDLGCGEGRLLEHLVASPSVTRATGVDVSMRSLRRASQRLRLERMPARQRERVELIQGALTYRDRRLANPDIVTVVEVIEHLDPERLDVFAQVLLDEVGPEVAILTTPNREYNVNFPQLGANGLRHGDHRFEWTRRELTTWVAAAAQRYGYRATHHGIGTDHPVTGPPTQMVVLQR